MTELVIDASVALAWCFGDERTEATASLLERLQTDAAAVPSLWHLEVANGLALAERRGRITPAESAELIALLEMIEIVVDGDTPARAFTRVLDLAREERLTAYDAAYLGRGGRIARGLSRLRLAVVHGCAFVARSAPRRCGR